MNIHKAFPSTYLKAADLEGHEFTVVISKMVSTDVGDDTKPVIYFENAEKGLVLNKTNALEIAAAYGDETDSWSGEEIVLYSAKVQYQGRTVDGIRIRIPSSATGEQSSSSDGDNTIPF